MYAKTKKRERFARNLLNYLLLKANFCPAFEKPLWENEKSFKSCGINKEWFANQKVVKTLFRTKKFPEPVTSKDPGSNLVRSEPTLLHSPDAMKLLLGLLLRRP